MTALVGLDVGTTGLKALAVSPDGDVLGRAEQDYPLSTPQPGWSEQDPEDWCRAAEAALDSLAVSDLAGIGLSGQMHGLVALDERSASCARPSSGTTSGRLPSAPRSRRGWGSSGSSS